MLIPWRSDDERVPSSPFNQTMHYQQLKMYLSISSSVLSPAVSCESFGSSTALTLVAIGGISISPVSQVSPSAEGLNSQIIYRVSSACVSWKQQLLS